MPRTRIVAWSAAYDLLVTFPFATPWTAAWLASALTRLHQQLGWSGAPPALDTPTAMLFANLMVSLVVVWSLVRLRTPTPALGLADSAARGLFAAWMAVALARGASPAVVPFLLAEVAWGLVQLAAVAPSRWLRPQPGR